MAKQETVIIGGIEYDRKAYMRGDKNLKPIEKEESADEPEQDLESENDSQEKDKPKTSKKKTPKK